MNSCCSNRPGAVYTPIQADTRTAEGMVDWGSNSKLGRPAQPSEVATSFVFLASAEAALFCEWLTIKPRATSRTAQLDANILLFQQTDRLCTVIRWVIKRMATIS